MHGWVSGGYLRVKYITVITVLIDGELYFPECTAAGLLASNWSVSPSSGGRRESSAESCGAEKKLTHAAGHISQLRAAQEEAPRRLR